MQPFRLDVGPLSIEFTSTRITVSGRWPGSPHLTAFTKPQPPGSRRAGLWTPHITFGRGRKTWLGAVGPDTMKRISDGVAQDMYKLWAKATTPVDLDTLSREEWWIYAPADAQAFLARLHRMFSVGTRRYRLNDERFKRFCLESSERFWDDCIDPRDLAQGYDRTHPYVAFRVTDEEDFDYCWVSARFTPEDGLGEWQRTLWDWQPEGGAMEIVLRHAGEGFRTAMYKTARALRLKDPFAPE